jgi:hypothetical protein
LLTNIRAKRDIDVLKNTSLSQVWWLMPVIPANREMGPARTKKVNETPSQPINWAWWHMCDSSYTCGINRRIAHTSKNV